MQSGILPTALLIHYIGVQFVIGMPGIVLVAISVFVVVTQKRLREYS